MKDIRKLQHLLWRTGFGPALASWPQWERMPEKDWWPHIKKQSEKPPDRIEITGDAVRGLFMGLGEAGRMERDGLDKEAKKELREKNRDGLQSLNLLWLEQMVRSKAQLREKMALFWHGHFASRNLNLVYQQDLLDRIRKNALGNFGMLLREVSKSAAILAFLNNQQNRKLHPNENFAREVMELFTLGRGHYTEDDIREAARAFTGWGFKIDGTFVFRRWDHDTGPKTVLGKTGNFTGDEVLDILLEQQQTAHFITRKLYRFLVDEEQAPDDRIVYLAERFYQSGYQITRLLDDIVGSDWFYESANRGRKIKSPVELWVGIRRTIPLTLGDPDAQLLLQKALGQVLLFPPNVAGWPGGRQWIDSSSLMLRLRLPQILLDAGELDMPDRADDDVAMGFQDPALRKGRKRLNATVDWKPALDYFNNRSAQQIAEYLWQTPADNLPLPVLEKHTLHNTPENHIKTTLIQLMATPEYQVC